MMMPDHMIRDWVQRGALGITPFDAAMVQPASVDLKLAGAVRVPCEPTPGGPEQWDIDVADVRPGHTRLERISPNGWVMNPGDFLLASTIERVRIPRSLAGRVEGKSSLGRLGLAVHVTAGFIDPGFQGQITLEIANLAPWSVRLRTGMPIAQLALTSMIDDPDRLYGQAGNHYQDQDGPVESRYTMP